MKFLRDYNEKTAQGLRVFVYYNLHKSVFSVKALEGTHKGRVIAHSRTVWLADAISKVSEAGRQRVLLERKKNVHAGIVGRLAAGLGDGQFIFDELTYNPYKYETFVSIKDKKPAKKKYDYVRLIDKHVFSYKVA